MNYPQARGGKFTSLEDECNWILSNAQVVNLSSIDRRQGKEESNPCIHETSTNEYTTLKKQTSEKHAVIFQGGWVVKGKAMKNICKKKI